jgi:hypothetical protein
MSENKFARRKWSFNWDHLMMSHWVWCLTPFLGQTNEHHNPFAL